MATATKKAPAKKAAAKTPAKKPTARLVDNTGIREHRDMPLRMLVKHPHNPRHRAIADPELVASVKSIGILQSLVVAPIEGDVDKFVVITGHRRLDAARKARLPSVPVEIRRDLATEAQQIEAMIVENIHRSDLTPIEEAEGYAQLELIGFKAPTIAAKVGRDVKTVRSRLRLLKLSQSTRKKVHAGQLTLDTAAAFVEFADDPKATKKLESAASRGDNYSLKHEISTQRRVRDQARDVAVRRAKLLDAGATELEAEGYNVYSLTGADLQRLEETHSIDWGQHKKCLAFAVYDNEYSGPQIYELCNNPTSHRAKLDDEKRQRKEEEEARQREVEERSLAEAAAADRRVGTLMDLAEGATVSDVLGDLVRALLPGLLRNMSGHELEAYQQAMAIPREDRWPFLGYYDDTKPINTTRFEQHVDEIRRGGSAGAARALAAYLVSEGEGSAPRSHYTHEHVAALEYFAVLTEGGHDYSPIDTEQRDAHQAAVDKSKGVTAGQERKAS
jgi:ParB/RepB/Spo0J family partition protein